MNKPNKRRMARLYEGRKTTFWEKITGRRHHRLSASVTGEGDWEVEVPQIRMSRAFAVMLVLHVIAVGGLFAYRIWGRDEEPKEGAEHAQASVPAATTEKATPISVPQTPAAPEASAGTVPERKIYIWRAGDSLQLVAASHGVSTAALREANPDKTMVPGTEITIPRAGRVFGNGEAPGPAHQPAAIFDPQANPALASASPEPPVPRAIVVPEIQEDSRVPDVISAPAAETNATAKPVTSRPAAKDTAASKTPEVKKTEKPAMGAKETTPKPPARTAGQRVHVVAKGDTVYNLARKYGFSADEVAKANGLKDYRISLGQQLKIPVKR